MTIKEITQEMLWTIRNERNKFKRTSDKEIAKTLNITPASFSRLITGTTEPKIMTWYKIYQEYLQIKGTQRTTELLSKMEKHGK